MPSTKSQNVKKRNRGEDAVWTDHQIVVVLAWLDHNLEIEPTLEIFATTVESHLTEACQVSYNLTQIRSKLGALWHGHGPHGTARARNLIYQEGSKCLVNLGSTLHESIARRKAHLAAIAHNQFVEQLSTRTTRSVSKSVSTGFLWPNSELDGGLVLSPSPRKKGRIEPLPQSLCPRIKVAENSAIEVRLSLSLTR